MKRNIFYFMLMLVSLSCGKETKRSAEYPQLAGTLGLCTNPIATETLSGVISGTKNLYSHTVYYLDGIVFVTGTLNIEAGTLIRGLAGIPPNGNNPGFPGGTLVIARGGYINAEGTATCPIVFTSYLDAPNAQSGDWGGVVILGRAPHSGPNTTLVEGVPDLPPVSVAYGGSVPTDNSGILKYVRIEYAGWEKAPDNELNGLTLAGVGSGTTIDYVEVFKAKDDAFQFFGGSVNAAHLVAVDPQDDMFDIESNYTGTINYALGLADQTRADRCQSNGVECDGAGTSAVLDHFTIIGLPNAALASTVYTSLSNGTYGRAMFFTNSAEYKVYNSVCIGYNRGISFVTSTLLDTHPSCAVDNVLAHGFAFTYFDESLMLDYAYPCGLNNSCYPGITLNQDIKLSNPFVRGPFSSYSALVTGDAHLYAAGAVPFGANWGNTWTRF